jgi:hypothetical protein
VSLESGLVFPWRGFRPRAGLRGLDRRGNLDGVDRRRRLRERHAGRHSLIVTSRNPNTRKVPGARWPRDGFHHHPGSAHRAVVDGRRLRTILVGLGIAVLTGLTTWAVASVSVWLVPVYLSLMVLTFAMPQAGRAELPVTEPSMGTSGADADASGQGPGEDRVDGTGEPRPDAEPVPDIPAGESAEAPTPQPDPAGTAAAKPKRSRSRSRKTAKSAVEPVPDVSSVTWIRVGPGKFVRADAGVQDPTQAQAEEVAPAANPATDSPEPAADLSDVAADIHPEMGEPDPAVAVDVHPETDGLAPPVPSSGEVVPVADVSTDAPEHEPPASEIIPDAGPVIDALEAVAPAPSPTVPFAVPEEPCPFDRLESTPAGEEMVASSVEEVSGSVAEEYGIAPSAFGPDSPEFPPARSLVPVVLDELVPPQSDPACIADPDGLPPGGDSLSDRLGARRQRSWVRTAFLPVGIANVSQGRGSEPASSRRRAHPRPGPRTAIRCSSPVDPRLRQAARRDSGRTQHFQRAWRPRSPPGRSA